MSAPATQAVEKFAKVAAMLLLPLLGIEPAKSTAEVAQSKGIQVITEFFGTELARQLTTVSRSSRVTYPALSKSNRRKAKRI